MTLDLKAIESVGFVGKPTKQIIEFNGQDWDVYIRKIPYSFIEENKEAIAKESMLSYVMIAGCVVDENNNPLFTVDSLLGKGSEENIKRGAISSDLMVILMNAIEEVNLGKPLT